MKRSRNSRLPALSLSNGLALILASIIAIVVFLLPTTALSQNSEWMNFTSANSDLPGNNIEALAVDNQGNIWIGMTPVSGATSSLGGLAKFDGTKWTVYNTDNSDLPSDCIKTLVADSQENIWVGTNNGLAKFNGINWTVYNKDNSGLPTNMLTALTFDTQGNLWIGTFDEGVVKFDGTNWTVYNYWNSGLPKGDVFTFAFDSQGNLWYGTISPDGGLVKFNGTNWTVYNRHITGLSMNYVRALAIDSQGNLWIGVMFPGQLIKFDGVNWTMYDEKNSGLPGDNLLALALDCQENIWIGTGGYGMAKFDGSHWTVYNKYNSSLPDNCVQVLAIDEKKNIWIGTRDGLSVYREGGVILNDPVVAVEERGNTEPSVFTLSQNYPNPFNPRTEISFSLSENSYVTMSVFNTLGQKLATLVDEKREAGRYRITWDGTNFPSGVYFYRLETEAHSTSSGQGFTRTMKMLLMK